MSSQKKSRVGINVGVACLVSTLGASALSLMVASPAAAGCGFLGQFPCPPKMTGPVNPVPEPIQTGFYRYNNLDKVFLVFQTNSMYCHVQTESVMNAYDQALAVEGGAREKIQVVRSGLLDRLQNTGLCTIPKGFYRRENEPVVYQLSGEASPRFQTGTRYCQVTTDDQMRQFGGSQQVQVVSANTNITTGRQSTGACTEKW